MKTLIVFYSRTGTTRKVAHEIQKALKADAEELFDKNRSGPIGYLQAGKEATLEKLTDIKPIKKDPKRYDLIILGTPVWAFNMCSAIRTYLTENHENLHKFSGCQKQKTVFKHKLKKVAFFCTMDSSGDDRTFRKMQELTQLKPKATLTLKTKDVHKKDFSKEIKEFVKKLK